MVVTVIADEVEVGARRRRSARTLPIVAMDHVHTEGVPDADHAGYCLVLLSNEIWRRSD